MGKDSDKTFGPLSIIIPNMDLIDHKMGLEGETQISTNAME